MVLKNSVPSASNCAAEDQRSGTLACRQRNEAGQSDRVIRWLDARSIGGRILLILGASVLLWAAILLGLGALLR